MVLIGIFLINCESHARGNSVMEYEGIRQIPVNTNELLNLFFEEVPFVIVLCSSY